MRFKRILFILGTRPEAIKLALLWEGIKKKRGDDCVRMCITGQHQEMLDQILKFFEIVPHYNLKLMSANQTLFDIMSKGIKETEVVLNDFNPDLIIVQGDTSSALIGALAGFYKKTKVAHVEAGLRSHNKFSPFPEEINRVLVDHLSDYHFAPTELSRINLSKENINKNVWIVGNTVIDALLFALKKIKKNKDIEERIINYFKSKLIDWKAIFEKKIIFVTAHRRESFGSPFYNICKALGEIARQFPEMQIIYPVHLNPNVQKPVFEILKEVKNIHLLDPLDYPQTIWLMQKSYLILTDSGGIQEEAPSLGKPVLVMREVTERVEGIQAGTAKLVGCSKQKIIDGVGRLIKNPEAYENMSKTGNPYGDGRSSMKIIEILGFKQ